MFARPRISKNDITIIIVSNPNDIEINLVPIERADSVPDPSRGGEARSRNTTSEPRSQHGSKPNGKCAANPSSRDQAEDFESKHPNGHGFDKC
jgi:hypothetical protein